MLDIKLFGNGNVDITFLHQQGPDPFTSTPERAAQLLDVAGRIAHFIDGAKATLEIAIYDMRLSSDAAKIVGDALRAAHARGVVTRLAYDAATAGDGSPPPNHLPDPTDGAGEVLHPPFIGDLATVADVRAIRGFGVLMHNKYIIRDIASADAALFMGSANFTNDSWSLQENNILFFHSQPFATFYSKNFEELWSRGKVADNTSYNDKGTVDIGGVSVSVAFTPGEAQAIVNQMVEVIQNAEHSVQIASVVISNRAILTALIAVLDAGKQLSGIFDGPQMDTVIAQWKEGHPDDPRIAQWTRISAVLNRKNSIPYSSTIPNQPHNFMHNKLIVADDNVITGSFNLSRHAMGNAENVVLIKNKDVADAYRAYLAQIMALYPKK